MPAFEICFVFLENDEGQIDLYKGCFGGKFTGGWILLYKYEIEHFLYDNFVMHG